MSEDRTAIFVRFGAVSSLRIMFWLLAVTTHSSSCSLLKKASAFVNWRDIAAGTPIWPAPISCSNMCSLQGESPGYGTWWIASFLSIL